MKLASVLLLITVMHVSAKTLGQTVTYKGKSVSLQQVFSVIREQTGYKFFYRNEDMTGISQISVQLERTPLQTALKTILVGQPLTFSIEGNTIFISRTENREKAVVSILPMPSLPPGEVHGTIRDADGNPLPNVTVILFKNSTVTITDNNGDFQLRNVNNGDTLMISRLGFESMVVRASTSGNMIIIMQPRVTDLSAITIINTGYQVLSRERATGSFGKPDMEVYSKRISSNDIISRLEGQVAGMTLSGPGMFTADRSGNGVATRRSIIRGISSVSVDSDPLYVLNGVVVSDFSSINVEDIEDITVLKDAAAAAIYGARAANGIVVIKTKSSHKNQKLSVTYSGNVTYQGKPDLDYHPMMNSRQYIQSARETFSPEAYSWPSIQYSMIPPHEVILYNQYRGLISAAQADKSLDSLAGINNLGQIKDLWYRNGIITNHTVSVGAGTEHYNFFASLGYTGIQSNTPGQKNNSYKLNINQQINAADKLNISLNTSIVNTVLHNDNPISISNSWLPYQLFRDAAGNDINLPFMTGYSDSLLQAYQQLGKIGLDYYPLQEMKYKSQDVNTLSMSIAANATARIWKGLQFQGTYGYRVTPGRSDYYNDTRSLDMRKQLLSFTRPGVNGSAPTYLLPTSGGTLNATTSNLWGWTARNQLVYNATPAHGRDQLTVQLGEEANESYSNITTNVIMGYDKQLGIGKVLDYNALTRVFGTVTGFGSLYVNPYMRTVQRSRFYSYFGLGSYTFRHKYSLDLSWRQDKSSLFGSDISEQSRPIWSIGGKWQIAKEAFMQPVKWLNELGLRATYGITGNSPYIGAASNYDILSAIQTSTSQGIGGDALQLASPANRHLAWERTENINIGIDFALLDRKLSGIIDLYNKNTTDLLASVPLNPLTGSGTGTGNIGNLRNRGIEVTLNSINVQNRQFIWNTRFVFSYNKNKLVSYSNPSDFMTTPSYILNAPYKVGYAVSPVFAYRYAGLDNMGDPQIQLADKSVTKTPNVATEKDMVYKGTSQPVMNGGLSNNFTYKSFSLGVNMVYSFGHKMWGEINRFYTDRLAYTASFSGGNTYASFLNRWKAPGDESKTNIPSYVADRYTNYSRRDVDYYIHGDVNVVSASYVKIRDVNLGWDLPAHVLHKLKLQRMNVYLQATNFLLWSNNGQGIDPEFGLTTPQYKHSYSLGLNLSL